MITVPTYQINALRYEIQQNRFSMLIYLDEPAFEAIPLPKLDSSVGPYKVRTITNHTIGAQMKVFFYPPDQRVAKEATEHLEPTRITADADLSYFPA